MILWWLLFFLLYFLISFSHNCPSFCVQFCTAYKHNLMISNSISGKNTTVVGGRPVAQSWRSLKRYMSDYIDSDNDNDNDQNREWETHSNESSSCLSLSLISPFLSSFHTLYLSVSLSLTLLHTLSLCLCLFFVICICLRWCCASLICWSLSLSLSYCLPQFAWGNAWVLPHTTPIHPPYTPLQPS